MLDISPGLAIACLCTLALVGAFVHYRSTVMGLLGRLKFRKFLKAFGNFIERISDGKFTNEETTAQTRDVLAAFPRLAVNVEGRKKIAAALRAIADGVEAG